MNKSTRRKLMGISAQVCAYKESIEDLKNDVEAIRDEEEEKYDNLLSTILVGNNIVNIALSSIATLFFIRLIDREATGETSPPLYLVGDDAHIVPFQQFSARF